MKRISMALILCFVFLGVWSSAHATLMLRLSDGLNPVANEVDSQEGALDRVVKFLGPIGDRAGNVSRGLRRPPLPIRIVHLNPFNTDAFTPASSTMPLGSTDLTLVSPALENNWEGMIEGLTPGPRWIDANNQSFAETMRIRPFGSFTGEAFSGAAHDLKGVDSLYSLTPQWEIMHLFRGSTTSEDMPPKPVSEPATMLLLGSGFIVLSGLGRKFLK
jgi:hypothetical protein